MDKIISSCGMVCSDCNSFPDECTGCPDIKGKAYWLQYVDASCCPIYQCCVNDKHYNHCGECIKMPCEKWSEFIDPTMSDEEAKAVDERRVNLLKSLQKNIINCYMSGRGML